MKKPITLQIEETRDLLIQVINQSNLPLFVLDNIIKDLYSEISTLSRQQTLKDKADYEKSLQEKNEVAKEE